MDFVLGAVITDGLRIPEAITFYAESDPGLEALNVEERRMLAQEGRGFTLHATRLYTLPVYVDVANGPLETAPGVVAHPVEKVLVSGNPAVSQRFDGAAVESGEHPRTVVRWFGQEIAYEARSPFEADLTLTLVQPDRLIAAALSGPLFGRPGRVGSPTRLPRGRIRRHAGRSLSVGRVPWLLGSSGGCAADGHPHC